MGYYLGFINVVKMLQVQGKPSFHQENKTISVALFYGKLNCLNLQCKQAYENHTRVFVNPYYRFLRERKGKYIYRKYPGRRYCKIIPGDPAY